MSNKGYYICSECKEEYISDFPFEEVNCLNCGNKIERVLISKGKGTRLLNQWKREEENDKLWRAE